MSFAGINWRKWQPEPSRAEVVAAAVRRLKRGDPDLHVTELFDVTHELLRRIEALEYKLLPDAFGYLRN